MYDYVLQYGFDKETQDYIQSIKNTLKSKNVIDRERNWLPHITIDLYDCKNKDEFIEKLDKIVQKISSFNIEFRNLNNFDNETLYIEPYNKNNLINLKSIFDEELKSYRLEKRLKRMYRPHVTLCTNDDLSIAYKVADEKFLSFNGTIKYIWCYNQDMELLKEYILNDI
ncbi:MAG: 2'-5' RNA ligase family protein [Clostridia bacterium]|jgi:2'-5' RNA ligase|nr:2'-5' RNA ligase family protein [Clostridia bacterium]